MPVLSIEDIKTEISSSTLDDIDLTRIVNSAYSRVLRLTGVSNDSTPDIQLAIEFTACAMTLRKMKTTDEMAATVETPGSKYTHTTDKDIDFYQAQADAITNKYAPLKRSSYLSPSYHSGFNCHGGR